MNVYLISVSSQGIDSGGAFDLETSPENFGNDMEKKEDDSKKPNFAKKLDFPENSNGNLRLYFQRISF